MYCCSVVQLQRSGNLHSASYPTPTPGMAKETGRNHSTYHYSTCKITFF